MPVAAARELAAAFVSQPWYSATTTTSPVPLAAAVRALGAGRSQSQRPYPFQSSPPSYGHGLPLPLPRQVFPCIIRQHSRQGSLFRFQSSAIRILGPAAPSLIALTNDAGFTSFVTGAKPWPIHTTIRRSNVSQRCGLHSLLLHALLPFSWRSFWSS
jgi:hypothetical protein